MVLVKYCTDRYNSAMGKAERTKKAIIEQVAPVFNRKGYAATTVSDLTKTTGLSKGAIYGNFAGKDEVALLAFAHNVAFIRRRLDENIGGVATFSEKLFAYPKTFREIYPKVLAAGGCPIVNTAVDSCDVNQPLQQAVRTVIEEWRGSLVKLLAGGVATGELRKNCDPEKSARVLVCLVEGGYAMAKVTGDVRYLENSLAEMEKILSALRDAPTAGKKKVSAAGGEEQ